jgi:hypothetical protein
MVLNRAARKEADTRLALLRKAVALQVFTLRFEDEACRLTRQAAEELAEASSRLAVDFADAHENVDLVRKFRVDAAPAIVVSAKDAPELAIYGVPTAFALPCLLDAILQAAGVPEVKRDLAEAIAEADFPDGRGSAVVRLDLVAARRDAFTVDAAAALWRYAAAARLVDLPVKPLASLRLIDDFPAWAGRLGDAALPRLFVDGRPILSWPFTDAGLVAAVAASSGFGRSAASSG